MDNPRRKPVVIRGARQVGKSTLVRHFARNSKLLLYEERPDLPVIAAGYLLVGILPVAMLAYSRSGSLTEIADSGCTMQLVAC